MAGYFARVVTLLLTLALLGDVASAQTAVSGSIAGIVRDSSGAVLPGATVEAASDALIEKVRSVATDDHGNYKIVDLRPGIYSVTVTLPGFASYRREGVDLAAGFTATVNGELRIGQLEETITVTGGSPIVDVQNVRQQKVLSRDLLDTLPNGKVLVSYASLIVGAKTSPASSGGASQDVGGNLGESPASFAVHGGRSAELKYFQDGMSFNTGNGGGVQRNFFINQIAVQEIGVQVGGMSAEAEIGGVTINVVPKDGGNAFKLYAPVSWTGRSLQHDNLTQALKIRGFGETTPTEYNYDVGLGLGGPVSKDRLWFYTSHRWWGSAQTVGGIGGFYNATPNSLFYTPDRSRPTKRDFRQRDNAGRVTWQVAQKHRIAGYFSKQDLCNCHAALTGRAPEASASNLYFPWLVQATWSSPVTNRLLVEAGMSHLRIHQEQALSPGSVPGAIAITEASTGLQYGSNGQTGANAYGVRENLNANQRFSTSYVTGSHAVKVGLQLQFGYMWNDQNINQSVTYRFLNGVPNQITQYAQPLLTRSDLKDKIGLYGQDQWTIRRITLNLGLRFDALNEQVPAVSLPAGIFVPARQLPAVANVPDWKDVSPRIGAAYDLFGNGRTAVKASLGRFVALESPAGANNPAAAMVTSATRTWNDANGDYVPQESELGPLSNSNFGRTVVTTRWDPEELAGWGRRGYNWQGSASVTHELRPGIGVSAGYFRTSYGNFRVTDNTLLGPQDFDSFCIAAPSDSRLPGGGGYQICGLYDISPAKFGLVENLVTSVSHFGKQTEVYNGVDLTMEARFGKGGILSGGMNTGRTVIDSCAALVDSPQKRFCREVVPPAAQTQVKFSGAYPLPWWNLQASGVYQNLPGIPLTATYTATNAQIAPSLGRNLGQCRGAATCNGTLTVALIEPGTMLESRGSQLDFRLTKTMKVGRGRLQGMLDVYNIFNASPVLEANGTYGRSWLQPSSILGGRLFKFGAQLDY